MAAGWISALKLVPWAEVLEATPQLVQGARRLLGASDKAAPPSAEPGSGADALQALEQRVAQLEEEQRDAAVLLQSLAEQNLQVVQMVQALRLRQKRLLGATAVLSALSAGLLAWALTR
ncbi:hypothetical protein B2J86_06210 [Acidovorax sp. SRB_14]|uniref:hypothetical protein n=1 Tax=unclassified Acidovorax TaxID=2684926 RepID=UPI00145EB99E|nr:MULTISPECIES: hypothetical protein [unclassified Acidovorax]NMM77131.1 hypothetical protein [Acidovorax sp. SRB_24]NMM80525.1 hypothetical protein [Acidovorax sp. SRB_14]NMM89525.1 hypothetical protein [Rhodococcus sp. SRB_17]